MDETDSDAVIVSEVASELSNDLNEFVIDDTTEGDEGEDFAEDETNKPESEDFSANIDDGESFNEEEENFESFLWHDELDNALNGDYVDHGIVKSICKFRVVPDQYR